MFKFVELCQRIPLLCWRRRGRHEKDTAWRIGLRTGLHHRVRRPWGAGRDGRQLLKPPPHRRGHCHRCDCHLLRPQFPRRVQAEPLPWQPEECGHRQHEFLLRSALRHRLFPWLDALRWRILRLCPSSRKPIFKDIPIHEKDLIGDVFTID